MAIKARQLKAEAKGVQILQIAALQTAARLARQLQNCVRLLWSEVLLRAVLLRTVMRRPGLTGWLRTVGRVAQRTAQEGAAVRACLMLRRR